MPMNNDPIFDKLPVVGQILLCSCMVLLVPLWFPFWIYEELKKDRIEKKQELDEKTKREIEDFFDGLREDLNG